MCRGRGTNVMVMDVEGTDGRERGEDQVRALIAMVPSYISFTLSRYPYQEFERKSTMFSLAVSEVLIVNLWENQVGLYQAANMALLKTVFEVSLSLFGNRAADRYVPGCWELAKSSRGS